jgi:hypothetical protein
MATGEHILEVNLGNFQEAVIVWWTPLSRQ